jgi:hypothetical protein
MPKPTTASVPGSGAGSGLSWRTIDVVKVKFDPEVWRSAWKKSKS